MVELYILEPWWAQTIGPALALPSCPVVGEQAEGWAGDTSTSLSSQLLSSQMAVAAWMSFCGNLLLPHDVYRLYVSVLIKRHLTVPVLVVLALWGSLSKGYDFVSQMVKNKQNHLFCRPVCCQMWALHQPLPTQPLRKGWRCPVPIQSHTRGSPSLRALNLGVLRAAVVTDGGRGLGCWWGRKTAEGSLSPNYLRVTDECEVGQNLFMSNSSLPSLVLTTI